MRSLQSNYRYAIAFLQIAEFINLKTHFSKANQIWPNQLGTSSESDLAGNVLENESFTASRTKNPSFTKIPISRKHFAVPNH